MDKLDKQKQLQYEINFLIYLPEFNKQFAIAIIDGKDAIICKFC